MSNLVLSKGSAAFIKPVHSSCKGFDLLRYNYGGNEFISIEDLSSAAEGAEGVYMTKQEATALLKWLQMTIPHMNDASEEVDYSLSLNILK